MRVAHWGPLCLTALRRYATARPREHRSRVPARCALGAPLSYRATSLRDCAPPRAPLAGPRALRIGGPFVLPRYVARRLRALSEPEIRSRALEASLRHSGNVEQLVQRCKASRALAKLDNTWRKRSPNPWHGGKLGSIRLVDIDGTGRRCGRMTAAVSAVPSNRAPAQRFALQRNVNFVAVVGACRKIDRAGIRGCR